jgi:hypothetical protein
MLKKHILLMIIFIGINTQIFALDVNQTVNEIIEYQQTVKSVKAYYTESTTVLGKKTSENGVYYKKGNNVRKNVQYPIPKIIIITPEFYYEKCLDTGEEKKVAVNVNQYEDLNLPINNFDPLEMLKKTQYTLDKETSDELSVKTNIKETILTLDFNKTKKNLKKIQINVKGGLISFVITNEYAESDLFPSKTTMIGKIKAGSLNYTIESVSSFRRIEINPEIQDSQFLIK